MNKTLCAQCNICKGLPEQEFVRDLFLSALPDSPYPILVIDNAHTFKQREGGIKVSEKLLGTYEFDYTTTIRCNFEVDEVSKESYQEAKRRCAVWTNLLLPERKLILATPLALQQMKTPDAEKREPGDMFKSGKYGNVLVIPTLTIMRTEEAPVYQNKIQRLLRSST